jgi:hypothetical protein
MSPSDAGTSTGATDVHSNSPERSVGVRQSPIPGPIRSPTAQERAWVRQMAQRHTRVPKGVFRYRTMEEANADWERWRAELVAETVATSRGR